MSVPAAVLSGGEPVPDCVGVILQQVKPQIYQYSDCGRSGRDAVITAEIVQAFQGIRRHGDIQMRVVSVVHI